MSTTRIASRYAKSILDLAQEQGNLDAVKADMDLFLKAIENKELARFFKSPIINPSKKLAVISEIFKGKVTDLTMGFFNIITKKGREKMLDDIAAEFVTQYKQLNKISTVKLTTASEVTDKTKEAIKQHLIDQKAIHPSVDLETVVDEDLIGGFKLEFDNQLYDASVAGKLAKLKKAFAENI